MPCRQIPQLRSMGRRRRSRNPSPTPERLQGSDMNANRADQPTLYDDLCDLPEGMTGEILSG